MSPWSWLQEVLNVELFSSIPIAPLIVTLDVHYLVQLWLKCSLSWVKWLLQVLIAWLQDTSQSYFKDCFVERSLKKIHCSIISCKALL